MPETPQRQADPVEKAKKTRELSNSARKAVVLAILPFTKDGVPERGVFKKISEKFAIHRSTVMQLWKAYGPYADQALNKPSDFFLTVILGAGHVSFILMMSVKLT